MEQDRASDPLTPAAACPVGVRPTERAGLTGIHVRARARFRPICTSV